jgi:hypothetical protein
VEKASRFSIRFLRRNWEISRRYLLEVLDNFGWEFVVEIFRVFILGLPDKFFYFFFGKLKEF